MRRFTQGFVFIFLISLVFPKAYGQEEVSSGGIREGFESEYYYAFTEATRYMIYQYYNQAVGLYQKCLEYNPGSAAIKYQLSKIYYRTGYIDEAKRLGVEAWKSERRNRWYLINLISIFQTTNRIDSAIMFTKELIELEPGRGENIVNLSILYQINREYTKALNLLERVENSYGKSVEIYTLKYSIYLSEKNKGKALQQLYRAHEMDPANVSIVGLIAEFYRDSGIRDSASDYYRRLLKHDSRDPVSVFSYLDYLLHFNEYSEAIEYFNSCMKSQVVTKEQTVSYFISKLESENKILSHRVFYDSAMTSFNRYYDSDIRVNALCVDYYFKMKDYNKAGDELRKMKLQNERNYRVWEQLLYVENIMNQYDSLIIHGDKAISFFEDQPVPYLYAGIGYLQKKDYTKALKTLEKGFKYAEDKNIYLQYCIFMAEAYNGLQNHEKSFEFYEKALSIDSTNQLILNNYAYFLSLEGKELEKAELMSKVTIRKERRNAIYLDTYAWILYKMEKKARAKCYISKAMKHGGGIDNDIHEHYKIIFKHKGE